MKIYEGREKNPGPEFVVKLGMKGVQDPSQ